MTNASEHQLTTFAWLSIATAAVTIVLKSAAFFFTGSVSLLSDAMESIVNLVAAVVALIALKLSASPPSARYTYGRSKAEYFSAALEGAMIFAAATVIMFSAIQRLITPQPVDSLSIGVIISCAAAVLNGVVGWYLIRVGRREQSITLEADGRHLLTDVITSAGVIIGLVLVMATDWQILDPIVAIAVAINIVFTGIQLLRRSLAGLMDVAIPTSEVARVRSIFHTYAVPGSIAFHGLQTRQAGRERFINVDLLVPGQWSVRRGHALAARIETDIAAQLPWTSVVIHVEPIEDEISYHDIPRGSVPLGEEEILTPPPACHDKPSAERTAEDQSAHHQERQHQGEKQ